MSELPEGWIVTTLGDVSEFVMGQAPPGSASNFDGDGTIFVKAGEFGALYPIVREWTTKPLKLAEERDILICVVGATAGKINFGMNCAIGRSVASIRLHEIINQKYLYYFMSTRVSALRATASGTAQGVISKDLLSTTRLPLAPSNEQERIVGRLEGILGRTKIARAELERLPILIERYKREVFKRAFTGQFTDRPVGEPSIGTHTDVFLESRRSDVARRQKAAGLGRDERTSLISRDATLSAAIAEHAEITQLPDHWTWCGIGEVFGVYVGATPSRKEPAYWGGAVPWVSSGEVAFCRIADTNERITEAGLAGASTRLHPVGTVLLGMIGEGKTRGQAAILEIEACNNQNCAAIRVSEARYPPEYLYWYLLYVYEQTRTSGGGNNQPALNKEKVQRLLIPLAPPAEAVRVVEELQRRLAPIFAIERELILTRRQIDRLDEKILEKAFRGELVPQDPNDEPASQLLERIREQRAAAAPKKRGQKKRGLEAAE